ncbi:hypothetical protein QE441_002532 [Chryseobacterium sp. SORGH_AS909]|uniref:Uncharacterized protein n=1 Tax=Chryseobacterium camelliae TaxID=1265445 RepID=A0ABU0TEF6_9FLAO|nr:hypothetical protein [Chryseobacterium camelliae]MDQ1099392.1 hypothetical protein [Chryseobacterium sp. SORGH_AS_1048]MDR6086738.1 hypothetical protein [Chryseobacterium sp. SORGH_AS_0909]MDR6131110.1 hypothetical protein [Chryseobacterium sp. SORGH_AS_1175]MDT3406751.1 hypothetical protein [Pseudacidovorax intermedius]
MKKSLQFGTGQGSGRRLSQGISFLASYIVM